MIQKMTGVFTAVVAALLMVGVAWAGGDDDSTSATSPGSTIVRIEDTSVPRDPGVSTPTSVDDSVTSTTVDGAVSTTSTTVGSTTSTTVGSTTSTTIGHTTSTSLDDNDDHRDETTIAPSGRTTHTIPGVGTVIIEVNNGRLVLVSVSAPGWVIEHDKVESHRIEIEFTSGDAEAEFEAELKDHGVEIEIRSKSD